MTALLKNNPFLGILLAATAFVALVGAYLLFAEAGRLGEERSAFEQKTMQLQRLQRNKPFPNQANLSAAEEEASEARRLLGEVAKSLAVEIPAITPQKYQDELAEMVQDIATRSAAKNIALPENFYLGFESYEKQLPAPDVAPRLAVQLRAIHTVAGILVDSQVQSVGPILRAPLRGEVPLPAVEEENESKGKGSDTLGIEIAPFDITFTANQAAFRTAFNRINDAQPPVFVRLMAIENSAPLPPPKNPGSSAANESAEAPDTASSGRIKPVVGRESVTVSLRLASVVSSAEQTESRPAK